MAGLGKLSCHDDNDARRSLIISPVNSLHENQNTLMSTSKSPLKVDSIQPGSATGLNMSKEKVHIASQQAAIDTLKQALVYLGPSFNKTQLHIYRLLVCSCGVEWTTLEECENFSEIFQHLEQKLPEEATSLTIHFIILLDRPKDHVEMLRKYEEKKVDVVSFIVQDLFLTLALVLIKMSQDQYTRFMELALERFFQNYNPDNLREPEILLENLLLNKFIHPQYLDLYFSWIDDAGHFKDLDKLKEFCKRHGIDNPCLTKNDVSELDTPQVTPQAHHGLETGFGSSENSCYGSFVLVPRNDDHEEEPLFSINYATSKFKAMRNHCFHTLTNSRCCRIIVALIIIVCVVFAVDLACSFYFVWKSVSSESEDQPIIGYVGHSITNLLHCVNHSSGVRSIEIELVDHVSVSLYLIEKDKLHVENKTLAPKHRHNIKPFSTKVIAFNYYLQDDPVYVSDKLGTLSYSGTSAGSPACGAQFFLFSSNATYQIALKSHNNSFHYLIKSECIPPANYTNAANTYANFSFSFPLLTQGFYYVAAYVEEDFDLKEVVIDGFLTHYNISGLPVSVPFCSLNSKSPRCTVDEERIQEAHSELCILSESSSMEISRVKITLSSNTGLKKRLFSSLLLVH